MSNLKTLIILFFVLSLVGIFNLNKTFAQTPTPEAEKATQSSRIQEIKEKAQERVLAIKEQAKKRAFWGKLTEINNSTFVLETPEGKKHVKTESETQFFLGKKEIKFEELEIGNFIIALGFLSENKTLEGKRIISLEKAPPPALK